MYSTETSASTPRGAARDRAAAVITLGSIATPGSLLLLWHRWIGASRIVRRIGVHRRLLTILGFAAVAGSTAICLQPTKTYDAVVQATLPMHARTRTAPESGARLVSAAAASLARQGKSVDSTGAVLSLKTDAFTHMTSVSCSAPAAESASSLASSAAALLVNRDHRMWTDALGNATSTTASTLAEAPLARVVSMVGGDPAAAPPQYGLRWESERAPYSFAWLAAMIGLMAGLLLFAPLHGLSEKLDSLHTRIFAPRPARSSRFLGAPSSPDLSLTPLPTLAGVMLTTDLTSGASRPVLLDSDPALWAVLTGRSEGARPNAAQEGEHRFAREILVTRPMDDGCASSAVVLALARTLTQRGLRVTIVDSDFAGTFAQRDHIGLPEGLPGLSDLVFGDATLDDCLLDDDDYVGLQAVSAGEQLLDRGAMSQVLESSELLDALDLIAAVSDLVLIHGPAAESCRSLSARAEATLLVVPEDASDISLSARRCAIGALISSDANLTGLIEVCESETRDSPPSGTAASASTRR